MSSSWSHIALILYVDYIVICVDMRTAIGVCYGIVCILLLTMYFTPLLVECSSHPYFLFVVSVLPLGVQIIQVLELCLEFRVACSSLRDALMRNTGTWGKTIFNIIV